MNRFKSFGISIPMHAIVIGRKKKNKIMKKMFSTQLFQTRATLQNIFEKLTSTSLTDY